MTERFDRQICGCSRLQLLLCVREGLPKPRGHRNRCEGGLQQAWRRTETLLEGLAEGGRTTSGLFRRHRQALPATPPSRAPPQRGARVHGWRSPGQREGVAGQGEIFSRGPGGEGEDRVKVEGFQRVSAECEKCSAANREVARAPRLSEHRVTLWEKRSAAREGTVMTVKSAGAIGVMVLGCFGRGHKRRSVCQSARSNYAVPFFPTRVPAATHLSRGQRRFELMSRTNGVVWMVAQRRPTTALRRPEPASSQNATRTALGAR